MLGLFISHSKATFASGVKNEKLREYEYRYGKSNVDFITVLRAHFSFEFFAKAKT